MKPALKRGTAAAALTIAVAGGAINLRTPFSPVDVEACSYAMRLPEDYTIKPDAEKIRAMAAESGLTLEQAGEKYLKDHVSQKYGWDDAAKYKGPSKTVVFIVSDLSIIRKIYRLHEQKSDDDGFDDLWIDSKNLGDDPALVYFTRNVNNAIILNKEASTAVVPALDAAGKPQYLGNFFKGSYREISLKIDDIDARAQQEKHNFGGDADDQIRERMYAAHHIVEDIVSGKIQTEGYWRKRGLPDIKIFGDRKEAHAIAGIIDSLRKRFRDEYWKAYPAKAPLILQQIITSCGPVPDQAVAQAFWFELPPEIEAAKGSKGYGYYFGPGLIEISHEDQILEMKTADVIKDPSRFIRVLRAVYFADKNLEFALENLRPRLDPR